MNIRKVKMLLIIVALTGAGQVLGRRCIECYTFDSKGNALNSGKTTRHCAKFYPTCSCKNLGHPDRCKNAYSKAHVISDALLWAAVQLAVTST